MPSPCLACGCTETDINPTRGETCCAGCGMVLEESAVVANLEFSERAGGGFSLQGQQVPSGYHAGIGGRSGGTSDEAVARGFSRISRLASRLQIAEHVEKGATRIYRAIFFRGFTKGRKSMHVAAGCLYLSCRMQKSPHMLIDFADVLQCSVKELGQVFLKLVRIFPPDELPVVDPSLFMERFACRLDLGSADMMVARTAVRLMQAMNRDWIATGRRPTGLCGACLLISCRYHGFNTPPSKLADVVRIAESTIRRRLNEFQQTDASQLTREEFEQNDWLQLPTTSLPPALIRNRKREAKALLAVNADDSSDEILALSDDGLLKTRIELNLSEEDAKKAYTGDEGSLPSADDITKLSSILDDAIQKATSNGTEDAMRSLFERPIDIRNEEDIAETTSAEEINDITQLKNKIGTCDNNQANPVENEGNAKECENHASTQASTQPRTQPSTEASTQASAQDISIQAMDDSESCIQVLGDQTTQNTEDLSESKDKNESNDTSVEFVLSQLNEGDEITPLEDEDEVCQDVIETLSDVDDAEIDPLILSQEESKAKSIIWNELHRDSFKEWMIRQEHKKNRKEVTKRKKHVPIPTGDVSAAEATQMALERVSKNAAKRVNMNYLNTLFAS
eukprot:GHVL01012648.1.p1 GENE.GHVL01012648.1~~GHVL01012648.1.p1  ORF type:complete len:624 (+),score=132.54 GHVL01012648.1:52-1923(+)